MLTGVETAVAIPMQRSGLVGVDHLSYWKPR